MTLSLERPVVDVVCMDDYETALDRLLWLQLDPVTFLALPDAQGQGHLTAVGRAWRERAAARLNDQIDAYLSDRTVPRTEKQFLARIQTLAQGYKEGAQALEWAAHRLLKMHGDGYGANRTHQASTAMARVAQELMGEE